MTATDSSLERVTSASRATEARPSDDYPDAVRMALVATAMVVVGFFLCHLPYGRLVSVFLSLAAAGLAGLSLLGLDRRAWLGWLGVASNAVMAVMLVGFPSQFGLKGWWPDRSQPAPEAPPAGMTPDGWVDAALAAWEEDGVQVALTFATVGPDPTAPQSRGRAESRLWIGVQVTNKSTRTVDFDAWDASDSSGPVLTTADGRGVAGRRTGKPTATKLAQGKSAECLLSFAVPPDGQALRLELPARNYGGSSPPRFQIAPELILRK